MHKLFFILITILLLLLQAFAEVSPSSKALASKDEGVVGNGITHLQTHHPKKINCHYACSRRCRKASRKKVCNRACKTCCMRCHCVPPGTYGNQDACPCYASLKTHGNKHKCP